MPSSRTRILPGHVALQMVDGEASDFPGLLDLLTVSQLSQMHTAEDTEETEVLHLFAIVAMPPRDQSLQSVQDLFKLSMEAHEQACALHQLENLNEAQQHLLLAAMNGFLAYLTDVRINPDSYFIETKRYCFVEEEKIMLNEMQWFENNITEGFQLRHFASFYKILVNKISGSL